MGRDSVKIGIWLEQTTVEAGDVLKGRVNLSIRNQCQFAQGVRLLVVGEEVTCIEREREQHQLDGAPKFDRASSSIVHLDLPLHSFLSGGVSPGKYSYPIIWPLPPNLPSSTMLDKVTRKGCGSSCEIRYKITAYLDKDGTTPYSLELSHSVSLRVFGASTKQRADPMVCPLEEFNIRDCCKSFGNIMLGWDTDTTVATPQSTIRVGIVGKNNSIAHVDCLKVCWDETVTLLANGRTSKYTRTLAKAKISPTTDLWRPLLNLPSQNKLRRLRCVGHSELIQNRCTALLRLPKDARDSYQGNLISVRHSLSVAAVTSDWCTASPVSSILVQFQHRMGSNECSIRNTQ